MDLKISLILLQVEDTSNFSRALLWQVLNKSAVVAVTPFRIPTEMRSPSVTRCDVSLALCEPCSLAAASAASRERPSSVAEENPWGFGVHNPSRWALRAVADQGSPAAL